MKRLLACMSAVWILFVGCGPADSGGGDGDDVPENTLKVESSCYSENDGTCLNYIKYPDGATEADFEDLCKEPSVFSQKACPLNEVFGECSVTFQGGTVITYFFPPYTLAEAEQTCSNQDGEFTNR